MASPDTDATVVAGSLRQRLVTGSSTRLTMTLSELMTEFGQASVNGESVSLVVPALIAAGIDARPDITPSSLPGARVTLKAGARPEVTSNLETVHVVDVSEGVLVSTTFEIPGFETIEFHGEVFGLVVRSRNIVSNMGASAKALVGGELRGLTKLLADGRRDAIARMRIEAVGRGGNAVVGTRYDSSDISDTASEVVAYGTAVTVRPREELNE